MAQHFLLSAKARTISLKAVYQMGEAKAYDLFRSLRWPETEGEAVCPRCGCTDAYDIPTRRKFQCRACGHQFSVTSGTIFAGRKLAFTDLLAAIVLFVNGAKGVSALQISRDLDCQYKTAYVLCHKLREAMALEDKGQTLEGEVEVDGAYFGGHMRPANNRENPKDSIYRLDPHRAATVREIFRLATSGMGKHLIASTLNQRQVATWVHGNRRANGWQPSYKAAFQIGYHSQYRHQQGPGSIPSREGWFEHRQGCALGLKVVYDVQHVAGAAPKPIQLDHDQLITLAKEF